MSQLPTEQQVIEYVVQHPNCKSKEIAKFFGCNTADINKRRENYRGIYSIPILEHKDFKHTVIEKIPPTSILSRYKVAFRRRTDSVSSEDSCIYPICNTSDASTQTTNCIVHNDECECKLPISTGTQTEFPDFSDLPPPPIEMLM